MISWQESLRLCDLKKSAQFTGCRDLEKSRWSSVGEVTVMIGFLMISKEKFMSGFMYIFNICLILLVFLLYENSRGFFKRYETNLH